jgi:hypothetical protein
VSGVISAVQKTEASGVPPATSQLGMVVQVLCSILVRLEAFDGHLDRTGGIRGGAASQLIINPFSFGEVFCFLPEIFLVFFFFFGFYLFILFHFSNLKLVL